MITCWNWWPISFKLTLVSLKHLISQKAKFISNRDEGDEGDEGDERDGKSFIPDSTFTIQKNTLPLSSLYSLEVFYPLKNQDLALNRNGKIGLKQKICSS